MKRLTTLVTLLALVTLAVMSSFATANDRVSWKATDGYRTSARSTDTATAATSDRYVCNKMPVRQPRGAMFAVNFNDDGWISANPGQTDIDADLLWSEYLGWGERSHFAYLPLSTSSYNFTWYFDGVDGLSELRSLRVCVLVFKFRPWGAELKRSYWSEPIVPNGDELLFSPDLPPVDNGFQYIGAMQALLNTA